MSSGFDSTLSRTAKRVTIIIPANSGNGSSLATLMGLTADEQTRLLGIRLLPWLADGTTDRPAFDLSDVAAMATSSRWKSGVDYYEPIIQAGATFVRSTTAGAVANVQAVAYLV